MTGLTAFLRRIKEKEACAREGEYAVYYVKGPYESLAESYPRLLEEIRRQGYRLDGDVYEGISDFGAYR